ncbi:MAG: carboxypeptidase regulatory-like domain-containing protein [Planctomycetes bacterium]|nr:carboxypeptidase regulatory-like domain-containing protein [Planctomycetota bacterium]
MLKRKRVFLAAAVLLLLMAASMAVLLKPGESAAMVPAAAPGGRRAFAPPELTLPVRDGVLAEPGTAADAPAAAGEPETAPQGYGAVRGTLFDDRGKRLPYRVVVFLQQDGRLPFTSATVSDTTDSEGDYWRERLPAGQWAAGIRGDGAYNSTFTSLAALTIWKDQVTTLDLFLPGTRVLSGNLTHVHPGAALWLTLRIACNGQVVARGEAVSLGFPKEALPEGPPDPLPPKFLPGYFRFEGLYPTKYVLSAVLAAEFPEVLEKLVKPFEVEVDLSAGDEALPPRSFTHLDFGLPFDPYAEGLDVAEAGRKEGAEAAEKRGP